MGGGGINGATSPNGASPFGAAAAARATPGGGGGFSNSGSWFGGSQNSFGQNSNPAPGSSSNAAARVQIRIPGPDTTPQAPNAASPGTPREHPGVTGQDQLAGTTFGGGPIVGVVSASKKDTIREFNHKKKYNEWQFIYDPATDRGGLLMTPNQPPIDGIRPGRAEP